jgi:TatD DNase family protein
VPYRGKRNEPAYVIYAAAAIAEVRQQPLEDIARLTRANTERCFRLPQS